MCRFREPDGRDRGGHLPGGDARPDRDHELPVHLHGEADGRGRGFVDELRRRGGHASVWLGRHGHSCGHLNATPHPSISLTKTTPDDLVAGDPIVYTITATNNGDVTLTDVQI